MFNFDRMTPLRLLKLKKTQLIGAVAQLGARLNGIQEVTGSIPVSSTFKYNGLTDFG